jgi:aromatic ring-opening dioxygenase catalytic subunit (LigB family)
MSLVYAGVCCHAPGITSRTETADPQIVKGLYAAFDRQRQAIQTSAAEALVVVSSEHFANFFMDNMPTFTIGMADVYEGPIEDPDWLKIQHTEIPANADLSRRLINEVMETVDVGYAQEWKFDHGMSVPLHFLTPDYDIPVVPVNINCQAPPFSPPHRSWELGKALRRAIDKAPEKIALIGTGGTSHWPCTPDSGKINEEWDRRFVDQVIAKDKDALLSYDAAQTYREAGQGAGEMRTSICLAAATQDVLGEVWYLEPIPAFATSCLIATLYQ